MIRDLKPENVILMSEFTNQSGNPDVFLVDTPLYENTKVKVHRVINYQASSVSFSSSVGGMSDSSLAALLLWGSTIVCTENRILLCPL